MTVLRFKGKVLFDLSRNRNWTEVRGEYKLMPTVDNPDRVKLYNVKTLDGIDMVMSGWVIFLNSKNTNTNTTILDFESLNPIKLSKYILK